MSPKLQTERENIMSALRYLTDEARAQGNEDLYLILQSALHMAENDSKMQDLESMDTTHDSDVGIVLEFLVNFHSAPETVQHKFVELARQIEKRR